MAKWLVLLAILFSHPCYSQFDFICAYSDDYIAIGDFLSIETQLGQAPNSYGCVHAFGCNYELYHQYLVSRLPTCVIGNGFQALVIFGVPTIFPPCPGPQEERNTQIIYGTLPKRGEVFEVIDKVGQCLWLRGCR